MFKLINLELDKKTTRYRTSINTKYKYFILHLTLREEISNSRIMFNDKN